MSAKITLFILLSVWVSSSYAGVRFFPDRNNQTRFYEEDWTSELFLRRLADSGSLGSNAENSNSAPISVKLQGDSVLGYYYITLFFGTPLQRQTLIVDTGSSITTFPCQDCVDDCGTNHWNKKFDTSQSQSFEEFLCNEKFGEWQCSDCNGKCYFGIGYAEGSSYAGHYKKDYVAFGNEIEEYYQLLKNQSHALEQGQGSIDENTEDNLNRQARQSELEQILEKRKLLMPFGCANKETKLFKEQEADGIMGLGISTNSRSYPPNLMDVYESSHAGSSRAFSICYAQSDGYLTVGGHNTAYHTPEDEVKTIDFHDEYHQYRVVLDKITVGGKDIGLDKPQLNLGNGAFFDSGTTYTHLPRTNYDAILEGVRQYCKGDNSKCGGTGEVPGKPCWIYNPSQYSNITEFYKTFPTVDVYMGDDGTGKYEWKPEDYLYHNYEYAAGAKYCMGISVYDRETILGGTFMKNHDVLFDKNQKKLSFVRANCRALMEKEPITHYYEPEVTTEEQKPNPNTKEPDTVDNKREELIKMGIIISIGVVLGGIFYLYVTCRNRKKYNDMANEGELNDKELKQRSDDSSHVGGSEETPRAESKNGFPEYEV